MNDRDVRAVLLRMLHDDMVVLQEVPKTADHTVLRTFYLYGADEVSVSLLCDTLFVLPTFHCRVEHFVHCICDCVKCCKTYYVDCITRKVNP
jgi:hypothetical protein